MQVWVSRSASWILAAMAERREEEEGGEGARRWSSGGSYRPRSSWAREVVFGGSRFCPERLDGERAEEVAALRRPGCRGGSGRRLGRVCARGGAKGRPGGAKRFPRVHLAVARGGRSPPAAYGGRRENRAPGREREVKVRAYL